MEKEENKLLPLEETNSDLLAEVIKATGGKLAVAKRDQNAVFKELEKNSLSVVDHINKITLLTANDAKMLDQAKQFILSTYTDVPMYRPLIIKMASVLNDAQFPTPDAKFWQCKKEAEVHFNQLVSEIFKLQRATVDLEEMDYVIASFEKALEEKIDGKDPKIMEFEKRRLMIKRDEYLFSMKQVEKSVKFRVQEVVEWAAIAASMVKGCKHDKKNHNAHVIENFYKKLQSDIKNVSEDNKPLYEAQLSTLKRIIEELH